MWRWDWWGVGDDDDDDEEWEWECGRLNMKDVKKIEDEHKARPNLEMRR